MSRIVCIPKSLTPEQAELARRRSAEINPRNVQHVHEVARTPVGRRGGPRRLVLVVGNRWPESGVELSVQFLDAPSTALRKRILLHLNAWSDFANVRFRETHGQGQVRIARLDAPEDVAGYWSYVGTEIEGIALDAPTMNLQEFTMRTPDEEFFRVVRHEAGHTLGFDHEHMRTELVRKIDRKKAIRYYDKLCGWTPQETIDQVLTPLAKKSIIGTTEADPESIMCYQVPADITKDGKAIPGGLDINEKDAEFAAKMYPLPTRGNRRDAEPSVAAATVDSPGAAPPTRASLEQAFDTMHIVVLDAAQPGQAAGNTSESEPTSNYARIFASYGGARATAWMRTRKENRNAPPTLFGEIIRVHNNLQAYTAGVPGRDIPDEATLLQFGAHLFETLFIDGIRRLYDEACALQRSRPLDLVFTSMVPWIAELPWEFAMDAARGSFIATEDVHFIRNVLTSVPADIPEPIAGPLRRLVASAQPVGYDKLSIEDEEHMIRRGFQALIDEGAVEVTALPRATPASLRDHVKTGRSSVVHFIGHGEFDEDRQESRLLFVDERGREMPLGPRSVREILLNSGVRMVFLNACETARGPRRQEDVRRLGAFNKGLAQSLVGRGLPALVANQYSVLDVSATSFAQTFYAELAQGASIAMAAREARVAVNYSLKGDPIDWAIPAVYARDPSFRLVVPGSVPARQVRRAPARERELRVALWDVDGAFPELESVAARLQDVQAEVDVQVAALSVPVDAFDRENRAPEGEPYLWAERLARRLARTPGDLGVDALVCFTRRWLRDDDWFDLGQWMQSEDPKTKTAPIAILSYAGLDPLPTRGAEAARMLANGVVTALAGVVGRLAIHEGGSRRCPMASKAADSVAHLSAMHAFDPACRAALAKTRSKLLAALDQMSNAFPRE